MDQTEEPVESAGVAESITVDVVPSAVGDVAADRVEQVVKWIVDGQSSFDIEASIKEHWPDQDIGPLALAATAKLIDSSRITPDVVKGFCVEATREMYRRLVEEHEYGQALRAIRQLWEMTSTVKL